MAQVPITNNGKNPRYVGTTCILPGETRFVDESLLPVSQRRPNAPEPVVTEPEGVEALLAGKVADIIKALPGLDDEDFAILALLEDESKKPRSSLMKAIAEEELRRADQQAAAEG